MNTNVDFEEHTVDKEKRQKKIESKKRDKVKSTGRKKMHSPKDNRNSAFRNNYGNKPNYRRRSYSYVYSKTY